ncbi:unnamed protein product [Trichogramma brassicae]|uniref:Uncharacterized protein n=1 Tax=Trichogramma brassicae TaxID=86971 RepID=A0A6H5J1H7_9HYME|nr:unnamed protein product [Trichogramma brassicae]
MALIDDSFTPNFLATELILSPKSSKSTSKYSSSKCNSSTEKIYTLKRHKYNKMPPITTNIQKLYKIDAILQKAAESIEDVEKFVDGIGLIVTQVQNVQQIKEVKGRLKNLAKSPKGSSKTASIIDALRVQYEGNDDWNKLGFIMNPRDNVNQLEKQLKGKSTAALIVSKWQIQNVLRDVSKEIKTMTEGFVVQEEFVDIFEMVQEGINIMIELYDTIEEYRYRAELGAYIANINMHTTGRNDTKVAIFNEAINELMLVIQNNVVLHNYKIATNVVKQRVFPFAHAFFASYKLPDILKPNSTSEIGTEVAKELEKLKNHLTLTSSTTNDWDKHVNEQEREANASKHIFMRSFSFSLPRHHKRKKETKRRRSFQRSRVYTPECIYELLYRKIRMHRRDPARVCASTICARVPRARLYLYFKNLPVSRRSLNIEVKVVRSSVYILARATTKRCSTAACI